MAYRRSKYVHFNACIYFQAGYYLILKLSHPMLLHTKDDALKKISNLQHKTSDTGYYDGRFYNIYIFSNMTSVTQQIWLLEKTLVYPLLCIPTREILPPVTLSLLVIKHDIVCVSKDEAEKIGEKGWRRREERGRRELREYWKIAFMMKRWLKELN